MTVRKPISTVSRDSAIASGVLVGAVGGSSSRIGHGFGLLEADSFTSQLASMLVSLNGG
jgi:hypothetical protein